MCSVCMVTQSYMDRWPQIYQFPPIEYIPFTRALEEAKQQDIVDGAPDCPSPEKLEWQRALEHQMKKIGVIAK